MKNNIFLLITILLFSPSSYAELIHHYDFNFDASDLVGGADGALLNGASVSEGVLNLDGINDYVQISSQIVPLSGSYTVALFAQQLSAQSSFVELISQGTTGGPGFYLGHDPDRNIRATDSWTNTATAFPAVGVSHHFSLVVDAIGNKSLLYVDGSLQATLGTAISTISSGSNTRFGRQFGVITEFFHGSLDDIKIYDSALTAGDVSSLANGVSSVPEPAAFWLIGTGLIGFVGRKK